ncbi:25923_t:CDS:1, partial [Racocetra persica]
KIYLSSITISIMSFHHMHSSKIKQVIFNQIGRTVMKTIKQDDKQGKRKKWSSKMVQ